ncbi:hypothetical protein [Paracoccus sulfuroxidans]|uniref:hypothetical protein n=1 Tax=Paracoccus sulfuroxidans TaxID=384678 RepID=UPI0011AA10BD|nr:hypothetical protein [Paracoccus sulfuroxidans]
MSGIAAEDPAPMTDRRLGRAGPPLRGQALSPSLFESSACLVATVNRVRSVRVTMKGPHLCNRSSSIVDHVEITHTAQSLRKTNSVTAMGRGNELRQDRLRAVTVALSG